LLVCYPQPGKARSRLVLDALAAGWRGGDATAFYGVVGIEASFAAARSGTWLYGDNAYFDGCRGKFFRFARDAFQVSGLQKPDHLRRSKQGLWVRPWRRDGEHVVVVEQSAHFLRISGAGEDWLRKTIETLRAHTDRPFSVRRWSRDKAGAAATLAADLEGAWALVTHMSAAANEAMLAGIPVFVTGPCAASPFAGEGLHAIERPRYSDGREEWAAGLAGSQWTLDELRDGTAWQRLRER
jgi:hypothetical protein